MSFRYSPGEPAAFASQFINSTAQHVFLTGNAGTGKTTFLKHIVDSTHKKAIVVAPTGIAALNAGGVTIHSLFQLAPGNYAPVRKLQLAEPHYGRILDTDAIVKNMQMNGNKQKLIRELELLIVDEVSMLRCDLLDAMDFVLRFVRKKMNQPFGGVQMLFIGDLLQLPPVVKEDEWKHLRSYYKSPFFFEALALKRSGLVYIELEKIYRQKDQNFVNLLNNIRNNNMTKDDAAMLNTFYRPDFRPAAEEGVITLTTHNFKADKQNKAALDALPGRAFKYRAQIDGDFSESNYPVDATLELKVDAQVMFIKNDPSENKLFFNGKIGKISELGDDIIKVKCKDESHEIQVNLYEWENIKYSLNETTGEIDTHKTGSFKQYPLKLAWAITVHKSQGLTFDKAAIDVQDAFASGQIYVALSRLRSLEGLMLTTPLSATAFKAEQSVLEFSNSKPALKDLEARIKNDRISFLLQQVERSFGFDSLCSMMTAHANTYDKTEGRSQKQNSANWAVQLAQQFNEMKSTADKFLIQARYILQQPEADMMHLKQRLTAAKEFFEPSLVNASKELFTQIDKVAEETGVKDYIMELREMELHVYEQLKQMRKCAWLVQAIVEDRPLDKSENPPGKSDAERMHLALHTKEIIQQQKKGNRRISKELAERNAHRKPRLPKKEKGDSQRVSLAMFKSGKSIEEISKERSMTYATIYGHIAKYVLLGDVPIENLIDAERAQIISNAITTVGGELTAPIRDYLGKDYRFEEIRLMMAWKKKEMS